MKNCPKCNQNDIEPVVFNNFKSLYCNNCNEDISFLNQNNSQSNANILTLSSSSDAFIKKLSSDIKHVDREKDLLYISFDGFEFKTHKSIKHKSGKRLYHVKKFIEMNKLLEYAQSMELTHIYIYDFDPDRFTFNSSLLKEFQDNISLLDIFKLNCKVQFTTDYKNLKYINQLTFFLEHFNEINMGCIKKSKEQITKEDWLFIINHKLNISHNELLKLSNLNEFDFENFKLLS